MANLFYTGHDIRMQQRFIRESIRSRLRRAKIWISNFEKDPKGQRIEHLEIRLTMIEQTWVEFLQLEKAHLEKYLFQEDTRREYIDSRDEVGRADIEDYYCEVSATAKILIAKLKKDDQNRSAIASNLNHSTRSSSSVNQIELPAITLPTFDGSYDEWPNFRDTFKAVIDENKNLSDFTKLCYLRLALQGVDAEIMASVMSADNYEIAREHLEEQFENS